VEAVADGLAQKRETAVQQNRRPQSQGQLRKASSCNEHAILQLRDAPGASAKSGSHHERWQPHAIFGVAHNALRATLERRKLFPAREAKKPRETVDGRVLQVESLRGGGSPSESAAANDRATSTSALFENQQHTGSVPRANPAPQFAPQSSLLFLRRELRPQKLFPFCPSKVGTVDLVPAISSQKRVKFFEDFA
jgi:hypothetical protein